MTYGGLIRGKGSLPEGDPGGIDGETNVAPEKDKKRSRRPSARGKGLFPGDKLPPTMIVTIFLYDKLGRVTNSFVVRPEN